MKNYADKQHILLIYFEQFYLLRRHSKSLVSLKFIFYSDDFVDDTTVTKQMCGTGNIFVANSHHSVKILFSLFYSPCDHFLLLKAFPYVFVKHIFENVLYCIKLKALYLQSVML